MRRIEGWPTAPDVDLRVDDQQTLLSAEFRKFRALPKVPVILSGASLRAQSKDSSRSSGIRPESRILRRPSSGSSTFIGTVTYGMEHLAGHRWIEVRVVHERPA